jgi:hypothetical protein
MCSAKTGLYETGRSWHVMTELERFLAVVHFEKPDYYPLLNTGGLGYVHEGGLVKLHNEGLPADVKDLETWCRYWGRCTFDFLESIGADAPGVRTETWIEGEFEFVRSECGAFTRQVLNNELMCVDRSKRATS